MKDDLPAYELSPNTITPQPLSPASSTSSIDLDYLSDDSPTPSSRGSSVLLSFPAELLDDFENVNVDALCDGDMVTDKCGMEWLWQRCFCRYKTCAGHAFRPKEGRAELSAQDKGRPEE